MLKEWSEFENAISNLSQQMENLERNSGLEQVNTRMEEIKYWGIVSMVGCFCGVEGRNDRYHAYKRHLEKSIRTLTKDDKNKTIELTQVKTDIRTLMEELHRFE